MATPLREAVDGADLERLRQRIAALEREVSALRDENARLRQAAAIARLPNTVASPATKVGLGILLETFERWENEERSGLQPFSEQVLAKQMGMGPRAASTVIAEAEELGVIRVERTTKGHGHGTRTHVRIEPTERVWNHPSTWSPEPRRDPNGKACSCNAPLVADVTRTRKTIIETKVVTKCGRCGTTHGTRIFRSDAPGRPSEKLGDPMRFESEEAAVRFVESGDLSGRVSASYWTSNSGTDRPESYQSGTHIRNKRAPGERPP